MLTRVRSSSFDTARSRRQRQRHRALLDEEKAAVEEVTVLHSAIARARGGADGVVDGAASAMAGPSCGAAFSPTVERPPPRIVPTSASTVAITSGGMGMGAGRAPPTPASPERRHTDGGLAGAPRRPAIVYQRPRR